MGVTIISTDFGEIKLGPKFAAVFSAEGLKKNKNSKTYKTAKRQADRTEQAFLLMHEACFMAGVEFPSVTP